MISRSFHRMVKPEHLNAANTLFGGTLVAWIDEASAMFAMEQMQTKRIVTLKLSEMLFKKPARQGDILEFTCYTKKIGRSSFTMMCTVRTKRIVPKEEPVDIARCELVFVSLDQVGFPTPYIARGDPSKAATVSGRMYLPEKESTYNLYIVRVGPQAVQLAKLVADQAACSITVAGEALNKIRSGSEWCLGKDLSLKEAKALAEPFEAIGAVTQLFENKEYDEPKWSGPVALPVQG